MFNEERYSHEQHVASDYFADDEQLKEKLGQLPDIDTVDEIVSREVDPRPKIRREVDPSGIRDKLKSKSKQNTDRSRSGQ